MAIWKIKQDSRYVVITKLNTDSSSDIVAQIEGEIRSNPTPVNLVDRWTQGDVHFLDNTLEEDIKVPKEVDPTLIDANSVDIGEQIELRSRVINDDIESGSIATHQVVQSIGQSHCNDWLVNCDEDSRHQSGENDFGVNMASNQQYGFKPSQDILAYNTLFNFITLKNDSSHSRNANVSDPRQCPTVKQVNDRIFIPFGEYQSSSMLVEIPCRAA